MGRLSSFRQVINPAGYFRDVVVENIQPLFGTVSNFHEIMKEA
jgi:hypothetical protein